MKLWVAGQYWPEGDWSIRGVFDAEEKAAAACTRDQDFIGPITLNETLQEERRWWPGCYYPRVETAEEAAARAETGPVVQVKKGWPWSMTSR